MIILALKTKRSDHVEMEGERQTEKEGESGQKEGGTKGRRGDYVKKEEWKKGTMT